MPTENNRKCNLYRILTETPFAITFITADDELIIDVLKKCYSQNLIAAVAEKYNGDVPQEVQREINRQAIIHGL